ncbi:hypothetical protein [Ralstonia pseudosolanacearum]
MNRTTAVRGRLACAAALAGWAAPAVAETNVTLYGRVQNSKNAAFSVEATDNRPLAGQGRNGAYVGIVHSF